MFHEARGGQRVRSGGMKERSDTIPIDQLEPSINVIEAAGNLLGTGIQLVLQHGITIHDPASSFATLATGAETLLKLSVGMCRLADGLPWPSKDEMSGPLRHRITEMHGMTLDGMRRRTTGAPPFLRPRIDTVANDERLTRILGCLDGYARQGRFHELDTLADSMPSGPSPRERWSAVKEDIARGDPEILASLGSADFKTIGWPRLNQPIADSLIRWWGLHHLIWMRGEFGRRAQLLSAHLSLPNALADRARTLG